MRQQVEVPAMSDRQQVVVASGSFSSVEALCVVASLTGDFDAKVEGDIVYPYYCFDAECSVPTLAGRKTLSLICLVDAINGIGATADSFVLKNEAVIVKSLLAGEIDDEAAADIAHRTVSHALGKKLRTITSFDVTLRPRGLVHKRFWIVQSSEARVMVDSMTGGVHPLKLRAA
jgi:hypothetical protein